jgi:hypothetical protein
MKGVHITITEPPHALSHLITTITTTRHEHPTKNTPLPPPRRFALSRRCWFWLPPIGNSLIDPIVSFVCVRVRRLASLFYAPGYVERLAARSQGNPTVWQS